MADKAGRTDDEPIRADRSGVGFLLNQAARAVRARLADDLRHHDLDDTDFIVLRNVIGASEHGVQGLRASDVAQALNMPVADINQAAIRLDQRGWLETSQVGDSLQLTPTRKAHTVVPGIADTARWTLERALNGFSRDEIEQLQDMLTRIIRNAGAET